MKEYRVYLIDTYYAPEVRIGTHSGDALSFHSDYAMHTSYNTRGFVTVSCRRDTEVIIDQTATYDLSDALKLHDMVQQHGIGDEEELFILERTRLNGRWTSYLDKCKFYKMLDELTQLVIN